MKICFIGAGSTVFAKNLLGDCILNPNLGEFEIALHDIDARRLSESFKLISAVNKYHNGKAKISVHVDRKEALEGADFVYVKNWSSYREYGKVLCADSGWMLTERHLRDAPNAKVMHCLPLRRNVELSDEILDGPRSLVQQQAANRVFAAQAVLKGMLEKNLEARGEK